VAKHRGQRDRVVRRGPLSLGHATGLASMFRPFWAMTDRRPMGGRGCGGGFSIRAGSTRLGNTGGFVGPYRIGAITIETHSFSSAVVDRGGCLRGRRRGLVCSPSARMGGLNPSIPSPLVQPKEPLVGKRFPSQKTAEPVRDVRKRTYADLHTICGKIHRPR